MRILLDTQILLWTASASHRLSAQARALIDAADSDPVFSVASLWEIVIKRALGRPDFQLDPTTFRRRLTEHGYEELPITGEHALAVGGLPAIHRDPFDRLLVAQAMVEGVPLLTSDETVARYGGPVRLV